MEYYLIIVCRGMLTEEYNVLHVIIYDTMINLDPLKKHVTSWLHHENCILSNTAVA